MGQLDADKDLAILAQHGLVIRPECARVLRVLTSLLQRAAARRMTPFEMASIMCRWALCSIHAAVQSCACLLPTSPWVHAPVRR